MPRQGRLGIDSHDGGRLPERRQRNRDDAGPPPRLAERARRGARRESDRLGRRSMPCWGRFASRCRCSAAICGPRPRSWASSDCGGGTCSRPSAAISRRVYLARGARRSSSKSSAAFSDEMGDYAPPARSIAAGSTPSRATANGAARFACRSMGVEESRILANFDGSFDQVSTLAHELGHGYHNHCQRGLAVAAARHADRRWPKRPAFFARR